MSAPMTDYRVGIKKLNQPKKALNFGSVNIRCTTRVNVETQIC